MLNDMGVDEDSKWDDVKDKILSKGLHLSEDQAHTMFK
jgi:hypothetical protein